MDIRDSALVVVLPALPAGMLGMLIIDSGGRVFFLIARRETP